MFSDKIKIITYYVICNLRYRQVNKFMITRLILNYHDHNVTISPEDRPSLDRTGKDSREGQNREGQNRGGQSRKGQTTEGQGRHRAAYA